MGEGTAQAHYVAVGFIDADGNTFAVRRERDRGVSPPVAEILSRLCQGEPAAAPPIETLIQASIIRDELIAALSLEKMSLVRGDRGSALERELPHGTQVGLAGAERRNRVDPVQVLALRQPQPRQLGVTEALP